MSVFFFFFSLFCVCMCTWYGASEDDNGHWSAHFRPFHLSSSIQSYQGEGEAPQHEEWNVYHWLPCTSVWSEENLLKGPRYYCIQSQWLQAGNWPIRRSLWLQTVLQGSPRGPSKSVFNLWFEWWYWLCK